MELGTIIGNVVRCEGLVNSRLLYVIYHDPLKQQKVRTSMTRAPTIHGSQNYIVSEFNNFQHKQKLKPVTRTKKSNTINYIKIKLDFEAPKIENINDLARAQVLTALFVILFRCFLYSSSSLCS